MLRVRTTLTGFTGGPGLTTFYFTCGTEDAAAAARARAYVHSYFNDVMKPVLWNGTTWTVQPEVDQMTSSDGAITGTIIESSSKTGGGTGGTFMASPASAIVARLTTGTYLSGRRLKGRIFQSPLSVNCSDNIGEVKAEILTLANAAAEAWLAALTSGDSQVVWHRPKAGTGGATGVVTSLTWNRKFGVLTSRRD